MWTPRTPFLKTEVASFQLLRPPAFQSTQLPTPSNSYTLQCQPLLHRPRPHAAREQGLRPTFFRGAGLHVPPPPPPDFLHRGPSMTPLTCNLKRLKATHLRSQLPLACCKERLQSKFHLSRSLAKAGANHVPNRRLKNLTLGCLSP